jgi:hypothetical protein
MVNEIKIPKENYKKVEEIRYLENQTEKQSNLVRLATFLGVPKVECCDYCKRDPRRRDRMVHVDTTREAMQHAEIEHRTMMREARSEVCNIL